MAAPRICLEMEVCLVSLGKCDPTWKDQWLITHHINLQDFQKSFQKEIQSS